MKQIAKKLLGEKNSIRISLFRKNAKISKNRILRSLSEKNGRPPLSAVRTFDLARAHLFFGYYDVLQFNSDENLLLAMAAPLINIAPSPKHFIKIGFFDLRKEKPEFKEFATTSTWCWQQGCRLQWYHLESEPVVVYNKLIEDRYGCAIQNIYTGEIIQSLKRPIYAVSRDGRWGLSLNFSRLQRLRPGYGYSVLPDNSQNNPKPADDGIWRIDMETGEENMLFSISDIAKMETEKTATGTQHYFNHLLFNINGDRFMFFHIWQTSDGKRKIRLLTSSIEGDDIRLLNNSGHASHYCWRDNDHLLCYSTIPGKGEGYYLYNDRTGEYDDVGTGTLIEDGHPSYLADGERLITDTYPDKYGDLSLLLYDSRNNELMVLHKQYMPIKYFAETRCDFHPRVSLTGKQVCIDCIVDNKRVMKLFELPEK
jgi:hypothetical protein